MSIDLTSLRRKLLHYSVFWRVKVAIEVADMRHKHKHSNISVVVRRNIHVNTSALRAPAGASSCIIHILTLSTIWYYYYINYSDFPTPSEISISFQREFWFYYFNLTFPTYFIDFCVDSRPARLVNVSPDTNQLLLNCMDSVNDGLHCHWPHS